MPLHPNQLLQLQRILQAFDHNNKFRRAFLKVRANTNPQSTEALSLSQCVAQDIALVCPNRASPQLSLAEMLSSCAEFFWPAAQNSPQRPPSCSSLQTQHYDAALPDRRDNCGGRVQEWWLPLVIVDLALGFAD